MTRQEYFNHLIEIPLFGIHVTYNEVLYLAVYKNDKNFVTVDQRDNMTSLLSPYVSVLVQRHEQTLPCSARVGRSSSHHSRP